MNFNTFGIALLLVGVVLVYSAIKARDPRDVVREALGRKPQETSFTATEEWKPAVKKTAPPTTVWTSV